MENKITQAKLDLIEKIIVAHLTPNELEDVMQFATSLTKERPHPAYKAG